MTVLRSRGRILPVLIACTAVLLFACGTTVERPFFVAEAGTLSKNLCLSVEHLPSGFEVIGKEIYDNEAAARSAPDPSHRAREYATWGRVTGSFVRWAFEPPSAPAEDADGTMSEAEIEAALELARQETLAAPFTGATCRVDLYETVAGAQQAFAAEAHDLLARPSTTSIESDTLGDESLLLARRHEALPVTQFVFLTRVQNVMGEVTVSASCGDGGDRPCAAVEDRVRSLGTLLVRTVLASAPLSTPVPAQDLPATGVTLREEAEQHCPVRDYSGCVAAYLEHAQQPEVSALCRTAYGQWYFEPPAGDVGELCSDGEATIVTVVGR